MKTTNRVRALSVIMSLLMVLSVISFPSLKAKAAGGVDGFVERCYTVTLGRGSDAAGFADWKDQLLNGKSVGVNIAYGFLFSAEYTNKKKSNEDYVKDLYKLFMDREPDQAGFNDWVGKLNNGSSREEVFAGFANSQEFYNICESYGITAGSFVVGYDRKQVNNVNLFVERLYQTCLGRRGDRGGQKDWVNKLVKKEITGVECARCFIQSKEYTNKGLNDDQFVENLYKAFMGRSSDAEGKANWTYALKNGMTRDEVFAGFANSKEFGDICASYKIDKGSYTAKDKGTYDPNKQQNNNQNNNTNNNNQNNNTNNNNQNNNTNNQNTNNQNNTNNNQNNNQNTNNNNNNQNTNNQNNNNQQNNNNNQNNNQNTNQEEPKKELKTGYRLSKITTKSYYDNGSFAGTYVDAYNYDANNKLTSVVTSFTSEQTKTTEIRERIEYGYDQNGNMIRECHYYSNGSVGNCYTYTYNSQGKMTEMRVVNPDNGQVRGLEKYNETGEMIAWYTYDYNTGELKEWVEYTLNSNGKRVLGRRHWIENGVEKVEDSETFEYDAAGNCIHSHIETNDAWTVKDYIYQYDSHNNETYRKYEFHEWESRSEHGGSSWGYTREYRTEYTYNSRGEKATQKFYNDTAGKHLLGSEASYEYEEYQYEE